MTIRWASFLLGALALLLALLAAGLIVILTGGYNVAASEPHSALGEWALHTTFRNSVKGGASGLEPPATFSPAMIAAGAGEYKSMCQHCHGGVNADRDEWAEGMRPLPPMLAADADRWSAAEIFWLVKHGAKMTGMPAFGATHDDATIWNIAAFVQALPQMDAAQYAAYPAEHDEHGEPYGEHGEDEEGGHTHPEGTPPHRD